MNFPIKELSKNKFPEKLKEINDPPEQLFYSGSLPNKENKLLCIVGSRRFTQYGKQATEKIVSEIRGYPITIISGLALGIDSIAHESAIRVGLQTIAVPGSGLDTKVIYPRSHTGLAEKILKTGGGLMSEFKPTQKAAPWTFPQRNRIMAGMSDMILVIEAEQKSGTLITSRLATEYNRDVGAVPGSIFSAASAGPHMLIRLGATPVYSGIDVLHQFGFNTDDDAKQNSLPLDLNEEEKKIAMLIKESNGISKNEILRISNFDTSKTQALIMSLEIAGVIEERLGKIFLK